MDVILTNQFNQTVYLKIRRIEMDQAGKTANTHGRILSAAAEIFSEVGFDGARVDAIAARAKVNKATLYYHIGDKKALYEAVLKDIVRIAADRIFRRIASATSPQEKLSIYIRTLIRRADENPHLPRIMMREVAAGGQHFPEEFVEDFTRLIGLLSGILEEGAAQGRFIEIAPISLHFMIIGTFIFLKTSHGLISQYVDHGRTDPVLQQHIPGNAAAEVEKLVLNAIKK